MSPIDFLNRCVPEDRKFFLERFSFFDSTQTVELHIAPISEPDPSGEIYALEVQIHPDLVQQMADFLDQNPDFDQDSLFQNALSFYIAFRNGVGG